MTITNKTIKFIGTLLIVFSLVMNPFFIEHFLSPDKQLDFLWKYFLPIYWQKYFLIFFICNFLGHFHRRSSIAYFVQMLMVEVILILYSKLILVLSIIQNFKL